MSQIFFLFVFCRINMIWWENCRMRWFTKDWTLVTIGVETTVIINQVKELDKWSVKTLKSLFFPLVSTTVKSKSWVEDLTFGSESCIHLFFSALICLIIIQIIENNYDAAWARAVVFFYTFSEFLLSFTFCTTRKLKRSGKLHILYFQKWTSLPINHWECCLESNLHLHSMSEVTCGFQFWSWWRTGDKINTSKWRLTTCLRVRYKCVGRCCCWERIRCFYHSAWCSVPTLVFLACGSSPVTRATWNVVRRIMPVLIFSG